VKITRVYSGADGESHFEEIDVDVGKLQPGDAIVFRHALPGDINECHVAPRRQYVINLSGQSEVEVGDGGKLRIGPGYIFLADDTTGRGHISRFVGNQPRL
jgi:hypothetical protein